MSKNNARTRGRCFISNEGGSANRKGFGIVELGRNGANHTIFSGFGRAELSSVSAIKAVIENGDEVKVTENYRNKGYDRLLFASRGFVDGRESFLGVPVNKYHNKKEGNEFTLHEVYVIEDSAEKDMEAPTVVTEPQKATSVWQDASNERIIQQNESVNSKLRTLRNASPTR